MSKRTPRKQGSDVDRQRWGALLATRSARAALTPFERELLDAPCPRHSSLAVCDGCTPPRGWDSTGFPSAMHAAGRGRYRGCASCGKLYQISEWSFATRSCKGCADEGRDAAAKVAKPAAASL